MAVGQELIVTDRSAFIPTERQCLAALCAVTERGPIGEPRTITSWPEFQRVYGGFIAGRVEAPVAKRALDNGCHLVVSRVVHLTDPADVSTRTSVPAAVTAVDRGAGPSSGRSTGAGAFPFRLTHGDTLVVTIDGGSPATATFNGFARRLSGTSGTYSAVTAAHVLVLVVNGIQRTVAFAGTENTAVAFATAINIGIPGVYADVLMGEVRITTDKKGTGASLSVHATTDTDVLASLGITSGQVAASLGSSNVADIEAVTAAEFETIVEAAVTGCSAGADSSGFPYIASSTTGASSSVLVGSSSTADDDFGFDTSTHSGVANLAANTLTFTASSDGTWANSLRIVISDDPGDPTNRFRLRVQTLAGAVLETHDGLSMTSTDPRYVVNVLRDESLTFIAADLASAATAPANRPATGTLVPISGADGLSGLVQADWIGDAAGHTGLHALDTERGFRLVAMPALGSAADNLSAANAHLTQVAAVAYCAARQDCRFIFSTPQGVTSSLNAIAYRRRTSPYATGTAHDTAYGALYANWTEIIDQVSKAPLWIPPDAEVLAAAARSNKAGGVWFAPCGSNRGKVDSEVRRLRFTPSDTEVRAMTAAGVNCIYRDPDYGMVLEGAWTLQQLESALKELQVCETIDFIGESVSINVRGLRYEPNDPELWRTLRNIADRFLSALKGKRGALTSYRVVCDRSNNTDPEIAARRTHIEMFIKPTPASVEQKIGITVVGQDAVLDAPAA